MASLSLEEHVAETSIAISAGVTKAQANSRKLGGNPIGPNGAGAEPVSEGGRLVRFSVPLEASEPKKSEISGDIRATLISAATGTVGAGTGKSNAGNGVHTVEFSVPMYVHSKRGNPEESEDGTDV
ncbi:MAG: hypothetical protein KDK02_10310 [Rhodobacteraceae bacterium]|nr:hypothetical protein [Paracoccaceae bacterium]